MQANIARCKFTRPTPIQKHALPIALAGRDLMACAQVPLAASPTDVLPADWGAPRPLRLLCSRQRLDGRRSVQTGSGKTCAYLLPCIQAVVLMRDRRGAPQRSRVAEPSVVVLAPTRELTQQVGLAPMALVRTRCTACNMDACLPIVQHTTYACSSHARAHARGHGPAPLREHAAFGTLSTHSTRAWSGLSGG
jgi:hypothetical protein